jgi:hypothetical protein
MIQSLYQSFCIGRYGWMELGKVPTRRARLMSSLTLDLVEPGLFEGESARLARGKWMTVSGSKLSRSSLGTASGGVGPYFSLPMSGYFFLTAALTFFSTVGGFLAARDRASRACASSSMGNARSSGNAKSLEGIFLRSFVVNFAMVASLSMVREL